MSKNIGATQILVMLGFSLLLFKPKWQAVLKLPTLTVYTTAGLALIIGLLGLAGIVHI